MRILPTTATMLLITSLSLSAQVTQLPISRISNSARMAYDQAMDASYKLDADRFLEAIDQSVKEEPNFFMAYFYKAMFFRFLGSEDLALVSIKDGLKLNPAHFNKSERILRKALVRLEKDVNSDVSVFFSTLVDSFPNIAQGYHLAIMNAWIANDLESSLVYAKKLVEIDPKFGEGHHVLGLSYMTIGETEAAKSCFEQYIKLAPKEANAYESMGAFYMTNKAYEKSAEFYEKAAELGQKSAAEKAAFARAQIIRN